MAAKKRVSTPPDKELDRLTKRINKLQPIVDKGFSQREMLSSRRPADIIKEFRSARAEQQLEKVKVQKLNRINTLTNVSGRATIEGIMGVPRGGGLSKHGR